MPKINLQELDDLLTDEDEMTEAQLRRAKEKQRAKGDLKKMPKLDLID
jgi:hypothetical protein